MRTERQINPETGEPVVVVFDNDGVPLRSYPDPGAFGAGWDEYGRELRGWGSTIASAFTGDERDAERAGEWAQWEPYYQAMRAEYPKATALGNMVPSVGMSMVNPFTGGSRAAGQIAANTGEALVEEFLSYDPLKELGDYGDAAVNAISGDLIFRGLSRALWGAENLLQNMGRGSVFKAPMSEAAEAVTNRGYKIVNPADMLPEGDPMRPMMQQAFKGNQSSARPSTEVAERTEFNMGRLRSRLREALGLPAGNHGFNQGDLYRAEQALNREYESLQRELPDVLEIPHAAVQSISGTPGFRQAEREGLPSYQDIRRYNREMDAWRAAGGSGELPDPPTIRKEELFGLRSSLTKNAAEVQDANVVRDIGERIDHIDAVVGNQATSPGFNDRYASARERWETLFMAQRPGVVGKDGNINLFSLARSMTSESNFGRRALYGDDGQFANQATGELANDVAALIQPETFANSQTTDRASFLKFAASAVDQPWYAASTLGTEFLIDASLRASDRGGNVTQGVGAALTGDLPPPGVGIAPTLLYGTDPGRRNQAATFGSQLFSRPEDSGNFLMDTVMPFLGGTLLPSEEVRDQMLPLFPGTEDVSP